MGEGGADNTVYTTLVRCTYDSTLLVQPRAVVRSVKLAMLLLYINIYIYIYYIYAMFPTTLILADYTWLRICISINFVYRTPYYVYIYTHTHTYIYIYCTIKVYVCMRVAQPHTQHWCLLVGGGTLSLVSLVTICYIEKEGGGGLPPCCS